MFRHDDYDPDELLRDEYAESDLMDDRDEEEEELILGEGRSSIEVDEDGVLLHE